MIGFWGIGEWGTSSWGGVPNPLLGAVQNVPCDVLGGTVLGVFGDNFVHPAVIDIIDMSSLQPIAQAYYFDPELDLRRNKILAGFPALPAGTYGLRVTTPAGSTPILPNALTYVVFADEGKVQRVRRNFGSFWAAGERILS